MNKCRELTAGQLQRIIDTIPEAFEDVMKVFDYETPEEARAYIASVAAAHGYKLTEQNELEPAAGFTTLKRLLDTLTTEQLREFASYLEALTAEQTTTALLPTCATILISMAATWAPWAACPLCSRRRA